MRNSLIVTAAAAAIAALFTLVTEPPAGIKSDKPEQPVSGIPKPDAKGNRLDYRPVDGCSPTRDNRNDEDRCVRVVDRWPIETSRPQVAA
jgi:hypothetical protein